MKEDEIEEWNVVGDFFHLLFIGALPTTRRRWEEKNFYRCVSRKSRRIFFFFFLSFFPFSFNCCSAKKARAKLFSRFFSPCVFCLLQRFKMWLACLLYAEAPKKFITFLFSFFSFFFLYFFSIPSHTCVWLFTPFQFIFLCLIFFFYLALRESITFSFICASFGKKKGLEAVYPDIHLKWSSLSLWCAVCAVFTFLFLSWIPPPLLIRSSYVKIT